MTGLGTLPGYSGSAAAAINNQGQIVGRLGSYFGRAFLYSSGQMYDLNSLVAPGQEIGGGGELDDAAGINDSGRIIVSSGGSAYLLTPVQGRFVPVAPCRVADTRTSAGPFGGPAIDPGSMRSFAIPQSACGIPATAQAYSLNVTAVPQGPLGYLTVWPAGMAQPFVSTLNSWDGDVVANAAIVAAGQNGAVSVFALANSPTDVILDINGYFDSTAGDSFYPAQPCRVADTRNPAGPLGGPSFSGGQIRDFPILSSPCGLPPAATAYSMNVTVVPDGPLSYLTTWPTGQPQPFVSTLNSLEGAVVANAAIVPAGTNGATSVYVTNPTDVILDTNGYFAPSAGPGGLTFYAVLPCRVADTRNPDGPFGGPEMEAGETRSFAIPASGCPVPSTAAAYSLNITVVPEGPLGYLTVWPTGAPQPFASTLNSWDGSVVANAAIVPAGANGAISVYALSNNPTHVIIDINGYFAP
jgi:probable HAF family extracellular repeat protein